MLQWTHTCATYDTHNASMHAIRYGRFPQFQSSNFQFESLKSEQINCGCFFDAMSDFNVPGSRPKKNDEISETDRTCLRGPSVSTGCGPMGSTLMGPLQK